MFNIKHISNEYLKWQEKLHHTCHFFCVSVSYLYTLGSIYFVFSWLCLLPSNLLSKTPINEYQIQQETLFNNRSEWFKKPIIPSVLSSKEILKNSNKRSIRHHEDEHSYWLLVSWCWWWYRVWLRQGLFLVFCCLQIWSCRSQWSHLSVWVSGGWCCLLLWLLLFLRS